jgi:hypothetical protein
MKSPKRTGRPALFAAAALGYLTIMVISGAPPTHENLVKADPNGVLAPAPARIAVVDLTRAGTTTRFHRNGDHWASTATGKNLDAASETLLIRAVTFMHTATPVRILRPEATAGVAAATYGLDPPSFGVRLATGEGRVLVAYFGGRSNDGMLQYLRVEGRGETYLMSGFVGEAWTRLAHGSGIR